MYRQTQEYEIGVEHWFIFLGGVGSCWRWECHLVGTKVSQNLRGESISYARVRPDACARINKSQEDEKVIFLF